MKYKTCVSIAEPTPKELQKTLKIALKKSELVEIRFDFLKAETIPQALEIVKKDLKRIVCTLRPKSEGGKFTGIEKERIAILKLISEYNPFLLDIEFNTIKHNKNLAKYLKRSKTSLLISEHDFKKTPNFTELKNKFNQMTKFSNNVKIVTTAKSTDDSTRILQLYSKKGRINLIAFAMGDYGRVSRILSLFLGSPFTYVSLGKPIAPGQFSVDEIKKIINLKK
ncbi:MAG: type I 3-dehydroquinate dehydratase [Nitrosopumilus sp.]|nr:type I 3-dehydroquinate dehydratase [Nitrosopumilus sp.]MDH3386036.1 type I 3-dehydroquinate dehydratase [Nitrosopumilus sp.]